MGLWIEKLQKKHYRARKRPDFLRRCTEPAPLRMRSAMSMFSRNSDRRLGRKNVSMFTSAGRTEISGNHTDHNNGKVLAGSINLDCVACAAANGTDEIHIISETYNQKFTININNLKPSDKMAGTIDLTKGMLAGFQEMGYQIGGFDAYITSNVISSAGVSSSASYEMLICSMINEFFNDGKVDVVTYAHVGQICGEQILEQGIRTSRPDGMCGRRHDHDRLQEPVKTGR